MGRAMYEAVRGTELFLARNTAISALKDAPHPTVALVTAAENAIWDDGFYFAGFSSGYHLRIPADGAGLTQEALDAVYAAGRRVAYKHPEMPDDPERYALMFPGMGELLPPPNFKLVTTETPSGWFHFDPNAAPRPLGEAQQEMGLFYYILATRHNYLLGHGDSGSGQAEDGSQLWTQLHGTFFLSQTGSEIYRVRARTEPSGLILLDGVEGPDPHTNARDIGFL